MSWNSLAPATSAQSRRAERDRGGAGKRCRGSERGAGLNAGYRRAARGAASHGMAASAADSASACSTVGHISSETALRRSGLSKTSRATGPALSAMTFPVMSYLRGRTTSALPLVETSPSWLVPVISSWTTAPASSLPATLPR